MHTTPEQSLLSRRVMRRVYAIWFVREVLPWVGLEVAAFAGIAMLMRAQVAIASVAENFQNICTMSGTGSCIKFMGYAFTHTNVVVQIASVALVALLSVIAYDFVRSFRRSVVALAQSRWARNLVRF